MIRFFDKAVQTGTGDDKLPTYGMVPYFEAYKSAETHVIRPARESDRRAYPDAWAAYEAAREPDHDGFPLAAWPQIDEADRKGLAERGIHTLERLIDADMTNAPVEFRDAQKHAAEFLSKLHAEGPKLAARIEELETENAMLKEEIVDLRKSHAERQSAIEAASVFEAENAELKGQNQELGETIEALNKELAIEKAKAAKAPKVN